MWAFPHNLFKKKNNNNKYRFFFFLIYKDLNYYKTLIWELAPRRSSLINKSIRGQGLSTNTRAKEPEYT